MLYLVTSALSLAPPMRGAVLTSSAVARAPSATMVASMESAFKSRIDSTVEGLTIGGIETFAAPTPNWGLFRSVSIFC